ncbi:MAG: HU family DNA-binding protein [Holosporaceae bacterium]|nr:HU family DNA-binding protein [Holosporaceae bacterium]
MTQRCWRSVSKRYSREFLKAFMKAIAKSLSNGEEVMPIGFGTFFRTRARSV